MEALRLSKIALSDGDWKRKPLATFAAVRQAVAEADAGLGIPLDQVEAELRREFGLQPRQPA